MKHQTQGKHFKRDFERIVKRGKNLVKLQQVLNYLFKGIPLPEQYRDHALTGNYAGYRECHLEPDWLLIYRTGPEFVYLARTGTHSDLFD